MAPSPSHRLPPILVALVAATIALGACGDGGSSGSSGSTTSAITSAIPPAGAPLLTTARLHDDDGDGRPSTGDRLLLTFDREVRASGDPRLSLILAPGDDLGGAAAFELNVLPAEAIVRLGVAPTLSIFGTWMPNRPAGPGASPATVSVAPGVTTITGATGDPAVSGPAIAILLAHPDQGAEEQGRPFTTPALTSARPVFGNLHAHTGYTDGVQDPARALAHARAHGLDFMAVTDHLEQLFDNTWAESKRMSDAADTPGTFVALPGWEWGHGYQPPLGWYNHVNVVGTTRRVDLLDTLTLPGLYREALTHCHPEGAIGIFNHPSINKPPLVYNNWDGFVYDGAADKLMALVDCEGAGSPQLPGLGFIPALGRGWRVAPAWNQDNHRDDWGDKDEGRTGVWVETLDRASLLRAVREGRAFSTSDRDARVRLIANGTLWMGSTITAPGPLALRVETGDAGNETIARIDLWSNGHVITTQPVNATASAIFELTVDPATDAYYFAHVVQQDGDELFSAPIYVDR